MCGRITVKRPLRDIAEEFSANLFTNFEFDFERLNVCPTQSIPIVRLSNDGRRELLPARWGLVPSWTRGPFPTKTYNARSDSAFTKPTFRSAIQSRRCLIPADGFYEPDHRAQNARPYYVHMKDDHLFAFAGLWERYHDPVTNRSLESCTILTTDASALISPFYHRMPVILSPDDYAAWLDPATPQTRLQSFLIPYPAHDLEAVTVQRMGNLDPPPLPEKSLFD